MLSVSAPGYLKFQVNKHHLRRADFKTGIILTVISGLMLNTALNYPLTDSYGGIENSWYVSPALFPLIISTALLICSVFLLVNSIRYGIRNKLLREYFSILQFIPGENGIRIAVILMFLGGYTYVLIPRVDFFVATAVFLFGFIPTFYVKDFSVTRLSIKAFAMGCLVIAVLALSGAGSAIKDHVIYIYDLLVIAIYIWSAVGLYAIGKSRPEIFSALNYCLAISITVALLICISFRFGLLVPLPKEGLVLELMHEIRNLLRSR